jgi:hypothetical protein
MSEKAKELLKELVSARSYLMSQLADEAEERGEQYLAEAWRWMRDNRKWPSPRHAPQDKAGQRSLWGWNFRGQSMKKSLHYGHSTLPILLLDPDKHYMKNKMYKSEEEALITAVEAMTKLFQDKAIGPNV